MLNHNHIPNATLPPPKWFLHEGGQCWEFFFSVSLIVRDKVTRQCSQTTTFEEKGEVMQNRAEVLLLTQTNALPLGHTGPRAFLVWLWWALLENRLLCWQISVTLLHISTALLANIGYFAGKSQLLCWQISAALLANATLLANLGDFTGKSRLICWSRPVADLIRAWWVSQRLCLVTTRWCSTKHCLMGRSVSVCSQQGDVRQNIV